VKQDLKECETQMKSTQETLAALTTKMASLTKMKAAMEVKRGVPEEK